MGRLGDSFGKYLYYLLVVLIFFLVLAEGIESGQPTKGKKWSKRDGKEPHGAAGARRISPRVLNKRSLPVNNTFSPNEKGNHLDEISIELPLDSGNFWLDLRLNRDLINDGYFERHQNNGSEIIHRPTPMTVDLCHYQGKIRGKRTSWAALSTCNGISGVVFDGKHLHHLTPYWSANLTRVEKSNGTNWDTLHYKHSDLRPSSNASSCEHANLHVPTEPSQDLNSLLRLSHSDSSTDSTSLKEAKRVKRSSNTENYHEPFDANQKSRYVEMVIVVDNKKYIELGSDLKRTISRTKEIANIVNALYSPLNIFIALVGVVVWTEKDEITLSSNGDDTLANFLYYRRERLLKEHPNDNAQLLTAVEFEKGVVGKAMQGPMCSYKFSGGVNSDHNSLTGIVATTVAHELGHNFGLPHDGDDCRCTGANGRCIMSASSSSNRTSTWSSCSLEHLAYAFDHGMDYCLRNKPKRLFDGPVCGNGFTEEGEECDCGLPDSETCRTNTCCNGATCRLHKNATCGAGSCCDLSICHYKVGGTVCRAASNICDLPEYCTGETEFCPDDINKHNGQQCETSNGQAYCYEGRCRTHTDQCRLLWGPSGNNSNYMCYQKNVNGSRYGNCGYDLVSGTYKACKLEDVRCGVLHCKYYHEKLEFGYEPVATLSSFFVSSQGDIHPCRSVTVDFGTQDVDPGLVPDGAKCGTDKMCVNQKCVTVESISAPFACPGGCGSYGVCNSKGHCHCDDGYGGRNCADSGFGGSVDSGPSVDPYATSLFAKSLYVTFLGFIPLIAIISFYIYYANENFKKLCVRGRAFARPQNRNRNGNNKSQTNGGMGMRTMEISSPAASNSSNNNSKVTTPDDFFGKYKGFTISPLPQSPDQPGSHNVTNVPETIKNFNNNSGTVRTANNGGIPSATNSNVYYSPVPTQTVNETLVKNNEMPSKSYASSLLQKGMARVSWAQPIAQPLPSNSPGSEDENTPAIDGSLSHNYGSSEPRPRFYSNFGSTGESIHANTGKGSGKNHSNTANSGDTHKLSTSSQSALSRLAGAIPFVRNSIRNFTSSIDESKIGTNPKPNRKALEISTPILHTGGDNKPAVNYQNLMSVSTDSDSKVEDEIDYANTGTKKTSKGRYANVPLIDESPVKTVNNSEKNWPKNSQIERIRPENKQTERKPVLRAHSMIQPSRNSIHNGNSNYNSLRRPRPSGPPPKPPSVPPPPPPSSTPPPVIVPQKARSESPPPITKTKNILRPPVTAANISSILKSFGRNNSNSNTFGYDSEIPKRTAPIAKLESDSSPTSPSGTTTNNTTVDNIYDEIGESKQQITKTEEKVETLSTGSAESAGGLLSEIISEIQHRNKESIYNSVDRRKKKRNNPEFENNKKIIEKAQTTNAQSKSPSMSPKSSPKFKTKPVVPPQPVSIKSLANDKVSQFRVSPPRTTSQSPSVLSSLNSQKRSNSPLLSTGTPPAYKPSTGTPPAYKPSTGTPPAYKPSTGTPPAYKPLPATPTLRSLTSPAASTSSNSTTIAAAPTTAVATTSASTNVAAASAEAQMKPTLATKPMCAVNGVPKVTSSPSYVAKINYFSNLSGNKAEEKLMKPINSLNTTLVDTKKAVASSIYAPSSVVTPEPTHLSTIRPTYARPYINNKLPTEEVEENSTETLSQAPTTQPPRTAGIYAPNSNSEYGTLGRNKGKKILEEKTNTESQTPPKPSQPQPQGYKPFNPYLNRPLTFSTFRPNSSPSQNSSIFNSKDGGANPPSNGSIVPPPPISSTALSNQKPIPISLGTLSKPKF